MAHNDEWIIVNSGARRNNSNFKYWIIHNSYQVIPDAEIDNKNTIGPLDNNNFKKLFNKKTIDLKLKSIE